MPDLEITVGDRNFTVACQAGEEPYLQAAAQILDAEAIPLQARVGRLPEVRMLLMAGLMLADRTTSVEEDLRRAKARIAEMERLLKHSGSADPAGAAQQVMASLEDLTAKAEALADRMEAQVSQSA
jgi:cell division protein ZapA